eukprot:9482809-Pyramimonas_sp.AAC.1
MPNFPVHTADFNPPQEFVLADTTVAERIVTAGLWIQYIARLQADLLTALLDDDRKAFFPATNNAELQRYILYITIGTGGNPLVNAIQGATSSVRANLLEKFNGNADKLELFLENMVTYFGVVNTPLEKRAGVLTL